MRSYFRGLLMHPGVPFASFMHVMGMMVVLTNQTQHGPVVGFLITGIFWVPVLLTVQRIEKE